MASPNPQWEYNQVQSHFTQHSSIACSGVDTPRTTSRVVTPSKRFSSYTPIFLRVSAAMGTVELTGLEMMFSSAWRRARGAVPRGGGGVGNAHRHARCDESWRSFASVKQAQAEMRGAAADVLLSGTPEGASQALLGFCACQSANQSCTVQCALLRASCISRILQIQVSSLRGSRLTSPTETICIRPLLPHARPTSGQCLPQASTRLFTMPALILNRSSRVMPGLRGTPAGMITTCAPFRASPSWSSPARK